MSRRRSTVAGDDLVPGVGTIRSVTGFDDVVIRTSGRRAASAAGPGLVFLPMAVVLLRRGGPGLVIGMITLVIFGAMTLIWLLVIVTRPVRITFGSGGLRLGALFPLRRKTVFWDDIRGVRLFQIPIPLGSGPRVLGLVPTDYTAPVWRGAGAAGYRRYGVTATIAERSIPLDLEELARLMRSYHPELSVDYA